MSVLTSVSEESKMSNIINKPLEKEVADPPKNSAVNKILLLQSTVYQQLKNVPSTI